MMTTQTTDRTCRRIARGLLGLIVGLTVTSGAALACPPDASSLPEGSAVLGAQDPDAQYKSDKSWSGGGTPSGSAATPAPAGFAAGGPQVDPFGGLDEGDRSAPDGFGSREDGGSGDALGSALDDFASGLVQRDLK